MKKAIFLLPVLAFVSFLSFCTKSNVQDEAMPSPGNSIAAERTDCCFRVFSDNVHDITICGTNLNLTQCLSCQGGVTNGVHVMVGDGSPMCFFFGTKFYVTTASPGGSWIRFAHVGGGIDPGWVFIPAGGCQGYYVNNTCQMTLI